MSFIHDLFCILLCRSGGRGKEWRLEFGTYLGFRALRDLVSRVIRVTTWIVGALDLLTKSPSTCKHGFLNHLGPKP